MSASRETSVVTCSNRRVSTQPGGDGGAAVTDDAAGFVPCREAGADAFNASVQWAERLRQARENGLGPLQAVRHWVGEVEDPKAGAVSGEEREAPILRALEALACGE